MIQMDIVDNVRTITISSSYLLVNNTDLNLKIKFLFSDKPL
jgi:hypothetical protein